MLPQNASFRITAIEPFSFYDAIFLWLDRILCMDWALNHTAWPDQRLCWSRQKMMAQIIESCWNRFHSSQWGCACAYLRTQAKSQYCFCWNSEILDIKMLQQGCFHDNCLKNKRRALESHKTPRNCCEQHNRYTSISVSTKSAERDLP